MKEPHRPTWVEISSAAIKRNGAAVREYLSAHNSTAEIYGVVKANGYGHGLVESARAIVAAGASKLCVASIDEAEALRSGGVETPLLCFGGTFGRVPRISNLTGISLTIGGWGDIEVVRNLNPGTTVSVQIKIDTGMNRVGFKEREWSRAIAEIAGCRNLQIDGVYSHFAMGTLASRPECIRQLEQFLKAAEQLEKLLGHRVVRHIANSPGLLILPESALDAVRPGLLLYGIYPAEELSSQLTLHGAATFRSEIVHIKSIERGESVSYSGLWTAHRDTKLAVVPVGYGDGYSRQLSNRGSVIIRGVEYPVIGRVCMDLLMCDIGDDPLTVGDPVLLFGEQGNKRIAAHTLAARAGMTPHEITTALAERVLRRWS